ATIASALLASLFASLAKDARESATAEREARLEADEERKTAETARVASEAEAYRAVLSEARALRAGREPGWRDDALADLSRLATSTSAKRNLFELRTEAAASLATPDVRLIAQFEPSNPLASFAFDPDGQTFVIVGPQSELDFWNLQQLKHVATADALAD